MRKAVRRCINLFLPHLRWPPPVVWIPTGNSGQLPQQLGPHIPLHAPPVTQLVYVLLEWRLPAFSCVSRLLTWKLKERGYPRAIPSKPRPSAFWVRACDSKAHRSPRPPPSSERPPTWLPQTGPRPTTPQDKSGDPGGLLPQKQANKKATLHLSPPTVPPVPAHLTHYPPPPASIPWLTDPAAGRPHTQPQLGKPSDRRHSRLRLRESRGARPAGPAVPPAARLCPG